jgi:integrase
MGQKRGKRGQGSVFLRNGLCWCDYSVDGVRRREPCKTSNRDEALAYLHRKQGKLASGQLLAPERVSVGDLLKLLLEDYAMRNVAQVYIATLKVNSILMPGLGNIKAAKLTSTRVKEFVRVRLKKVKPGTVNRELGLLHRAFQLGYDHDPPLVGRVPHFPKLEEDEPRQGFLKTEHYRKLLAELPKELRLLFVVAYHIGLRKGALLRIKWSQVDLGANTIWMEGKKANRKPEPIAVPIYGDMAKFLKTQPRAGESLFARGSKPIKDFRASWDLACERAGVPDLLFHDLRRTAVRNLRRAGVPETVIMKITGHRTRAVFERYNITDHSDTQEAGRQAEKFLSVEHKRSGTISGTKGRKAKKKGEA